MLKLLRISELLELYPEFREFQSRFEKLPASVFYYIYCGPEVLDNHDIPLYLRLTGCMTPVDEAECDPGHLKKHLWLLAHNKRYAIDQARHIEELHMFHHEVSRIKNIIDGKNAELGNKIARQLAVEFLGEEFVKDLEKKRMLAVDAKNGKKYWIDITGQIRRYRVKNRPSICTHVGDIKVPWDKVLIHVALLRTDKKFCNMVEAHR